jgi:hypothetical protein
MITQIARCAFLTLAVGLTLLMLADRPTAGQRVCCQGQDWWLAWSQDAREKYVWGYTTGYSHAYDNACRNIGTAAAPRTPGVNEALVADQCRQGQLDFSKGSEYLVESVTNFYKRYPGDRDLYIDEVLEQLGKGQTIEQIHEHPFWRHRKEPTKP